MMRNDEIRPNDEKTDRLLQQELIPANQKTPKMFFTQLLISSFLLISCCFHTSYSFQQVPPIPKRFINRRMLKMQANIEGISRLHQAFEIAMKARPQGGFPHFAEALRRSGFKSNHWVLPSCGSLYETSFGSFAQQLPPLLELGIPVPIPSFNREKVIQAIRDDQAGRTTFPEFLKGIWEAGIVAYDVDFDRRNVIYYGNDRSHFYEELYPAVELPVEVVSLFNDHH